MQCIIKRNKGSCYRGSPRTSISLYHVAIDPYRPFAKKLKVNHARQDNNYAMADKDETDNKHIRLE